MIIFWSRFAYAAIFKAALIVLLVLQLTNYTVVYCDLTANDTDVKLYVGLRNIIIRTAHIGSIQM